MKINKNTLNVMMSAIVVAFIGCNIDMPEEVQTSYETLTVEKKDITVPLRFSARLKGQADVTVTPQVSGQLIKICVTEGQQVAKGQTLFVIDSRNAQLDLEAAQANLQAALAQENSAKLEYDSNRNLFQKNIVSRYMLENSENAYRQAQASVAQAKAQVSRAKVNLGFCTITAPVTGVIGEIPVRTGDQVSPAVQLTILSGNTTMSAEFSVTEAILEESVSAGVNKSEKERYIATLPDVLFVMKNGTEYPYKGRVSSVTGVVDAATGSLGIKATFPNPDGHLYSGIQGTVVLPIANKGVIVVPQEAVVKLQDKQQVYKVKADSTATAITVTTVDAGNGEDVIVTSGLKVGDRIITTGANNVTEGQKVLFPENKNKEKK
jgi:membrane fusion protein (multidrug efflux system)